MGTRDALVRVGAQLVAARDVRERERDLTADLLAAARLALKHEDAEERVTGLEMVMMGGVQMAIADPAILSDVADLMSDSDAGVRQMACRALDHMEFEISPPPSAPSSQLVPAFGTAPEVTPSCGTRGLAALADTSSSVDGVLPCRLLDRVGSFNRKVPRPEALQALSTVLLGKDRKVVSFDSTCRRTFAAAGSSKAVAELRKSGVAEEVLPHLADAARASTEAPIRQAAVDTLMHLGKRRKGGRAADLELRAAAMDGLSVSLRARSNKLMNDLDDLFA